MLWSRISPDISYFAGSWSEIGTQMRIRILAWYLAYFLYINKYHKIPEAKKQGLYYMLLGLKKPMSNLPVFCRILFFTYVRVNKSFGSFLSVQRFGELIRKLWNPYLYIKNRLNIRQGSGSVFLSRIRQNNLDPDGSGSTTLLYKVRFWI